MKRSCVIGLSLLLLSLGCTKDRPLDNNTTQGKKTVGVFLFSQHPVIQEIYSGFRRNLDRYAQSNTTSVNYIEKNADGDASQAGAIANFFSRSNFDIVFVVGVPAAQALKSARIEAPVVFGGPPDPVAAGLVTKLSGHDSNFTGTQYLPPTAAILSVFRRLSPSASRIAVLHNPGEANSMAVVAPFLQAATLEGLEVRDIGVTNAAEIDAALRTLSANKVDGLFLPTDNLIYTNLDQIIRSSDSSKIPVFNCTRLAVEKGAIFSIATDYEKIGALTADVAARIIFEQQRPQDIDVLSVQTGSLYIKSGTDVQQIGPVPGYSVVEVP